MPRLPARAYLMFLNAAAVLPVWLFAAYLLTQHALNEHARFEREAERVARQTSVIVEAELTNLQTVIEGLAKSPAFTSSDFVRLHAEAERLVEGLDRIITISDSSGLQFVETGAPFRSNPRQAEPFPPARMQDLFVGPVVSDVFQNSASGEFRVELTISALGQGSSGLLISVSVPTREILNVMRPTVPDGWTIGIGDRNGAYITRSELHDEFTGRPGLPEYLAKVVGRSGTFTSLNLQGTHLLAGYYRSEKTGWFYTANVPLSVVEAPMWRSLWAAGGLAALAMLLSAGLAHIVGKGMTRATDDLARQAEALGKGEPVGALETKVSEFAAIADAMLTADRNIRERSRELEAVLDTAPVAVWFTYDPNARQVIRNRFAAELMGIAVKSPSAFGLPESVINTVAHQNGRPIEREERPLSRAMRGETTENQEYDYTLLDGTQRILLTSARPIWGPDGKIVGAVQISLDISERKRAEEQRMLLVNELNHRVKNTLAVVQSIASQSVKNAPSLSAAEKSIASRLASLGKAHDILTQENWTGANLEDVLWASLAPHAPVDRFEFSGRAIRISPSLSLSIAMALHELATNALKYGALSTPRGRVSIAWNLGQRGENHHLQIEWRERDGPTVHQPSRKGFGTRMLERLLGGERDGMITLNFEAPGVVCIIGTTLSDAA